MTDFSTSHERDELLNRTNQSARKDVEAYAQAQAQAQANTSTAGAAAGRANALTKQTSFESLLGQLQVANTDLRAKVGRANNLIGRATGEPPIRDGRAEDIETPNSLLAAFREELHQYQTELADLENSLSNLEEII